MQRVFLFRRRLSWWHLNALLIANNFIYLLDVSFTFRAFHCDIKISHTTISASKQNAKVAHRPRVLYVFFFFCFFFCILRRDQDTIYEKYLTAVCHLCLWQLKRYCDTAHAWESSVVVGRFGQPTKNQLNGISQLIEIYATIQTNDWDLWSVCLGMRCDEIRSARIMTKTLPRLSNSSPAFGMKSFG